MPPKIIIYLICFVSIFGNPLTTLNVLLTIFSIQNKTENNDSLPFLVRFSFFFLKKIPITNPNHISLIPPNYSFTNPLNNHSTHSSFSQSLIHLKRLVSFLKKIDNLSSSGKTSIQICFGSLCSGFFRGKEIASRKLFFKLSSTVRR